jgi:ABC-type transport system substrate-binding protein
MLKKMSDTLDLYSIVVRILAPLFAAALLATAGCGSTASAPSAPTATTTTSTIPPPSSVNLTGTWTGTGNDAQGAETFAWTVTQTGERVTGSVVLNSANPADGSCGSCHKQKAGTLAGTFSNGALTLTLDFPDGGSDITPLCGITMHATTSNVAAGRIAASYTGTTTCEGPITDGTLTVTR